MNSGLWSLLDITRGSHPMRVDSAGLLLQLLVWKRLEAESRVPGLRPLADVPEAAHPVLALEQGMDRLRSAKELGKDAAAFDKALLDWRRLDARQLEDLVRGVDQVGHLSVLPQELMETLTRVASYSPSEFGFVPYELASLMCSMGNLKERDSVYIPFDASWPLSVAAALSGAQVFVEFRTAESGQLTHLLNLLLGLDIQVAQSDPVYQPSWLDGPTLRQFDATIAVLPFGGRVHLDHIDPFGRFPERSSNPETLALQHIRSQTNGRAVVLVPNGLLFRASSRDLRWDLISRGHLAAIVALPSLTPASTSCPVSILLLDFGTKADAVLMIDASSDDFVDKKGRNSEVRIRESGRILEALDTRAETTCSRLVTVEEFAKHEFNLLPERYVHSAASKHASHLLSKSETELLGDLVEFIRPQSLRLDEGEDDCIHYKEVALQDVGADGYVHSPRKVIRVGRKSSGRAMQQRLEPHDVLLVIKGASVGRVAMTPPELPEPWLANQSFLVLRMKPRARLRSPVVLMRYLASPLGQAMLTSRAVGTAIPMIQAKDVRAVPVVIPSDEEHERILETHREIVELTRQVSQLQARCDALREAHWSLSEPSSESP